MAEAYDFGKAAEDQAAQFLESKDYQIISRNFRYQKAEIDLFVAKDGLLISVEVKARKSTVLSAPEEAVNTSKMTHILRATDRFLELHTEFQEVRFDILSVTMVNDQWHFHHIEDAFGAWDIL